MGETTYYLKARFASQAAAEDALPKVRAFLEEAGRAYDWWQNHRHWERGAKGNERFAPHDPRSKEIGSRERFWMEFHKQFPLTYKYLAAPIHSRYDVAKGGYGDPAALTGDDANNALSGVISFGDKEALDNLKVEDNTLLYDEYTWHLASWDALCEWLKQEFGAEAADWLSEENATVDYHDMIEV